MQEGGGCMDAVLIVEDNAELCDVIDFYLQKSGQFAVSIVHSAEDALELVATKSFDAILLDIMLPGIDGIAFCQKIRKSLYCPGSVPKSGVRGGGGHAPLPLARPGRPRIVVGLG